MNRLTKLLITSLTLLFLSACGGGGGGNDDSGTPSNVLSGVFVDAIVSGLDYSTPTQSNVTDAIGQFNYMAGETVTFSIGGILLGSATGGAVLTPLDLVPSATGVNDPRVLNIVRLLLSLDDDGNPDNGITISLTFQTAADSVSSEVQSLTTDIEVQNLLDTITGSAVMLVDNETAETHLRDTMVELGIPLPGIFTVGGNVTGLTGTLVLQNNSGDNLSVSGNIGFIFTNGLADQDSYNVTVLTNPNGQTCTVTNGGGAVSGTNVTDVTVTCVFDVTVIYVSVDATNANDANDGTRDNPLKTIIAAVDRVSGALGTSEIRVALGTYTTFDEGGTNIVVSDGMMLMGSYSADWLLRNPITYASIVNDTSTTTANDFNNPNCVINISAGAGSETRVDGFTLTGGGVTDGSGNGASCGIEIEMNASPTIENNIISGGSSASSTGIIDRGLSPVIRNNTIRGNEMGVESWLPSGISSNGSSPTIIGNVINAGSGLGYIGGAPPRGYGTGISLTDVINAIVEQNSVVGGSGEESLGVLIDASSTVLLRNNTIHGGNSYTTFGVLISPGNTVTLQNNTIFSGKNSGGFFEIALATSSPAIIENNTLFGSMCIYESGANADPIRLFANNLYDCGQGYYYDFDAQCTGNADGDNDASTCTLAEMNQLTDMQVDGSNINVDLVFGTQADADWHLNAASPSSVKFGGLDLSVDFSTDKDAMQRTVPWSIGAYEQD